MTVTARGAGRPPAAAAPAASSVESLHERGVRIVLGTAVDLAGVTRAKAVPVERFAAFCTTGVGVSPSVLAFCVDAAIAFPEGIGVVGDLRLCAEPDAVVVDEGIAWAPASIRDQDGEPFPGCPRSALLAVLDRARARGIEALSGAELEFVLTGPDGGRRERGSWQGYGVRAALDAGPFLTDAAQLLAEAGVPVEQMHAEYGADQFEVSLVPADPLVTADRTVLARLLLGRAAARHGLGLSFSPVPFPDSAGNGAHLHLSLTDAQGPLFAGGQGPHGLREIGGHAVAGIVEDLPELQGVVAGSVLSPHRLMPGNWAGAFACWGLENREAAVRLCAATPGNPDGANVELKCIDGSANPYLAAAALLGAALDGIERALPLPDEVTVDPAELPPAVRDRIALASDHEVVLDRLAASATARAILGDLVVDGTVSVRTHERVTYPDLDQATAVCRQAFSC
jgi:glutamine synthetase